MEVHASTLRQVLYLMLFGVSLHGQAVQLDELRVRRATIWSEGTRMSAEVYAPRGSEGKRLPTVIMSHGWGGTTAMLRRQAVDIARAGYLTVAFDYRGWGESEARVILTKPGKAEKPGGTKPRTSRTLSTGRTGKRTAIRSESDSGALAIQEGTSFMWRPWTTVSRHWSARLEAWIPASSWLTSRRGLQPTMARLGEREENWDILRREPL
ncbi:MAG: hypothetical protein EXQ52_12180 [Bryobacterales bacterium]|nr:hypothetical protein [Bryobacterales bacterium]